MRPLRLMVAAAVLAAGCGTQPAAAPDRESSRAAGSAAVAGPSPGSGNGPDPGRAPVPSGPPASTPSERVASTPSGGPTVPPSPDLPDGVHPTTVRIPAIDVDADVIELGQLPDGSLEVPRDFADTGWWSGGPRPGQPGAAVIAGHVDSRSGPAVFFRLRDLRASDEIVVDGAGGREIFVVDHVEQHPKGGFPTTAVYGHTVEPTLRLITCGGDFDRSARSYTDNLIVFATRGPG